MATTSTSIYNLPRSPSGYRSAPPGPRQGTAHHGVASARTKEFAPFRLDAVNQCLWRRDDGGPDQRVSMKPKSFAILQYLVDHPGRLVSQNELLDAIWPNTFVQPEVLKRHVFDIRDVLGDDPKDPTYIETLARRGYQFIAEVRVAGSEPSGVGIQSQKVVVGRDKSLADLGALLQASLSGRRQMVFITGESGIGKTTLVDQFEAQATLDAPIRIARGQCVEGHGGMEAYYAVLDAIGNLCRGPEGDAVVQILAAQAPTCLVQFPGLLKGQLREILQREVQGDARQRMLREIVEALPVIASQSPLLLILEDLHWADPSTVDFISALARGRGPAKLMVIGTYRPADVLESDHSLKPVKRDLLVHQLCHELALEPLREEDIEVYLAVGSPDGAPSGLAALLHRRSEGNPLFMVEILDHMSRRGFISRRSGAWKLIVPIEEIDTEVPASLQQMIEVQIERLSAQEYRALEAASVAGNVFCAATSAAAADMDVESFEDLCVGLARRHSMVRPANREKLPSSTAWQCYEFIHELHREVFYRRLSPERRARLCRQMAS